MKKFSPFIFYILFFTSFSAGFTQDIEPKRATIQETLVIGTSDSNPDYFFGDLGSSPLALDKDQNIYVPDNTEMSIKVYDKDGTFIRRIGSRGRGPGEFIHFTSMTVDRKRERLIVFDYMNFRATFFSLTGNVINTVKLSTDQIGWPRRVYNYRSGYLILAESSHSENLFHLYNNSLTEKEREFGKIDEYLYSINPGERAHLGFRPGNVTIYENQIYFAPFLYQGKLYKISSDLTQKEIRGYVHINKPYTFINENNKDFKEKDNPNHISIHIRGADYLMELHNDNRGIFTTSDGKLVNFTMIQNEEIRDFGVEIYQTNPTKLLNYYILESKPLKSNNAVDIPPKFVKAIDSENNFYMIEYGDKHLVKRFRLNVPELQQ